MFQIALLLLCGAAAYAAPTESAKSFNSDFAWAIANADAFRYSSLFGEPNVYPEVTFQEYTLKPDGKYYNSFETVDGVKVKAEGNFEKRGYKYVPNFKGYVEYKTFDGKPFSKDFYVNEYGYKFTDYKGSIPFSALNALNLVLSPAPYAASKYAARKFPNVISQKLVNNYDGSYSNSFETEDGFKVEEFRNYKVDDGMKVLSIEGKLSYVDEAGKEQSFKYYGDSNGYKLASPYSVESMPKSLSYAWDFLSQKGSYLSPYAYNYYPRTVYQSREYNKDGTFVNEFVTDAGVKVYEKGSYKVMDGVKYPFYDGKFSFADKSSGQAYSIDYFVNENGFNMKNNAKEFVVPFAVFKAIPFTAAASSYYPVPMSREAEHPKILSQTLKVNPDGTYVNAFSADNGITLSETGSVKYSPEGKPIPVVAGAVGYNGVDGKHYSITYSADENGYHPVLKIY